MQQQGVRVISPDGDFSVHPAVTDDLGTIGAADVVPFIPIDDVTIEECVALAVRVGTEIWSRLRVPVYLYESAARIPADSNTNSRRRARARRQNDTPRRPH